MYPRSPKGGDPFSFRLQTVKWRLEREHLKNKLRIRDRAKLRMHEPEFGSTTWQTSELHGSTLKSLVQYPEAAHGVRILARYTQRQILGSWPIVPGFCDSVQNTDSSSHRFWQHTCYQFGGGEFNGARPH
jgi:hypothetical protein